MAQDNNGKLLWFLAGGAIGATIALLYAPQTGRDTRRLIKKRTREGREALLDGSRDLVDKGRDWWTRGGNCTKKGAAWPTTPRRCWNAAAA